MPDEFEPISSPAPKKLAPSQVILILLYPVVFAIGLSAGLVIGIRQGQKTAFANQPANTNISKIPTTIIPNANTKTTANQNSNVNAPNSNTNTTPLLNTNVSVGGEFQQLDSNKVAALTAAEEADKKKLVDSNLPVTDVIRQQELISLKYDLKAYYAVHSAYPSTNNTQVKLEKGADDSFYQTMKDFYGGNYNEPIDPESPTYYYGYTSDGTTFTLTAYIVAQKKPFILKDTP